MSAVLHVLTEGQTESAFVSLMLKEHLARYALAVNTVIVKTRSFPIAPSDRGGSVSYRQLRDQVFKLLKDSRAVAVTTLFDFYARPTGLPHLDNTQGKGISFVTSLESAMEHDIGSDRFIAHFQVHDFEALLFAAPSVTAQLLECSVDALEKVRRAFPTPEDINDDPSTCPSARLKHVCPNYDKAVDGPRVAAEISIETLRTECPHFGAWLARLEALGEPDRQV